MNCRVNSRWIGLWDLRIQLRKLLSVIELMNNVYDVPYRESVLRLLVNQPDSL